MKKDCDTVAEIIPPHTIDGWCPLWLRWKPTSMFRLALIEARIFNRLSCSITSKFVKIFDKEYINTIEVRSNSPDEKYGQRTPILLVHGMGAGVAMWCKNLEELSEKRPVYAFDLLGFGRSSRPQFTDDDVEAEEKFVSSIEEVRKRLNIEKCILVGHSLGGFLCYSYAIRHPERISHLVMIDPWGFPSQSNENIPGWAKFAISVAGFFYPLSIIRAVGPFGPHLISSLRNDLKMVFSYDGEPNDEVLEYIYHSNAQNPSGEVAFKSMNVNLGWAKRPMLERASALDSSIAVTFIHGRRSWIDQNSGIILKKLQPNSFIKVNIIEGAGHHVYAEKSNTVNKMLNEIGDDVDDSQKMIAVNND